MFSAVFSQKRLGVILPGAPRNDVHSGQGKPVRVPVPGREALMKVLGNGPHGGQW